MMMKMLGAGGLPLLTDRKRAADDDNPEGYFEYEPVVRLAEDSSWMPEARGRVIKVISELLKHLPATEEYRVIFMVRRVEEILASQRKMLERRGTAKPGGTPDSKMRGILMRHIDEILRWADGAPHLSLLPVSFNQMFLKPAEHAARIADFLGGDLDRKAMAEVVDPKLYRQRRAE